MAFCSFAKDSAMFDSTPIENMFLLEHMPHLPDDCVRVYLYARMLCYHPEMGGDTAEIAKALRMEENAVLDAFHCLEQQGLVTKMSDRPPTYCFNSLNSGIYVKEDASMRKRMDYHGEILKILGVSSIASKHTRMTYDWLDVLGFSQEAALEILKYEKKVSGKLAPGTLISFADSRASNWADRGIHTLEDIQQAIIYDDQVYSTAKALLQHLGMSRNATNDELECARRWIHDWHLSLEDILASCAKTTKARNPSFGYLDTILKSNLDPNTNQHFETVKAILQELGAASTTPTSEQRNKYAALLETGFEPETIMMAAIQCANKGWHTYDKLEWMLAQWADEKVYTKAQAEAFLSVKQQIKEELRALYKEAGMVRSVYTSDISLYEVWKQKYSHEMILCAAECALGAREPTKYMNKLLAEWEKSRITSPEAARAQHHAYQGTTTATKTPRHLNYLQHAVTEETYGKSSYADPTKDLE